MTYAIHYIDDTESHWLTDVAARGRGASLKFWRAHIGDGGADMAVYVTMEGSSEIVAWFRIGLNRELHKAYTLGTWVHPKHRRRGLARWMWSEMIARAGLKEICVSSVTRSGSAFASAMVGAHPIDIFHKRLSS